MKNEIPSDFLSEILRKWGDTWWFKVVFFVLLIYFISIPIITPAITDKYHQQTLNTTLDDRDRDATKKHRANFEISRQAYAIAKHKMTEYLISSGCEYIFLLEFHNGSENVMTGIQFCRFDMTLEVAGEKLKYIPLEKFKDDIVARYDILLSDELTKNKVIYCQASDFEKVDRYLAYQMSYINAKAYAMISLKDKDGKIFGAVLGVTNDNDNIDLLSIRDLAEDLEDIFTLTEENNEKNDIKTHHIH